MQITDVRIRKVEKEGSRMGITHIFAVGINLDTWARAK